MILPEHLQETGPQGDLRRAKISSITAQMEEYEELLPYLTYQEREDLDRLLASVYTPIWEPFPGPQSMALDSEADELFYGGAAGGGKALTLTSKILTPKGWTTMGKIEVGDEVITPSGNTAEVTGCFPQGFREIYKVTFQDGSSVRCDLDHVWAVCNPNQHGSAYKAEIFERKTLREIISEPLMYKNPNSNKSIFRNYIPIIKPGLDLTLPGDSDDLESRPVHPYLLGALIGDGCFRMNYQIGFTSIDSPIIERVRECLPQGDTLVKRWIIGKDCDMGINGGITRRAIEKMGLWGHKSPDKWIPLAYLWTTWENRLQILQGLMDTDGTAGGGTGGYPIFNTSSGKLAKDVRFLVQSLGGTSTMSLRNAPQKNGTGLLAYNVTMRLPPGVVPFQLSRKVSLFESVNHQLPLRGIKKVEYLEVQQAKCISISDPEGLYITDEFIVTHNTDLLLGAALTRHWRSIIFRREYAELKGIRERSEELYEGIAKFNGNQELWRFLEGQFKGKRVEFGACQYEGDERKFQGRPHDLKAFDEITQFTEAQFRFLTTWNRTTHKGQRVRAIATGNPPVSAEGQWVVGYWAPWLDPRHPNPAKQGELRWFITGPDGKDTEVDGSQPVPIVYEGGEEDLVYPKSRTFIKARVEDNPRLMETGYRRTLQNLPEPLRSMMLRGDFGVGHEDAEWQIIPTDWIYAAQARWAPSFEEFLQKQEARLKGEALEEAEALPQDATKTEAPETLSNSPAPPLNPEARVGAEVQDESSASIPAQQSKTYTDSMGRTRISEPALPASLLGGSGIDITPIISRKSEEEKYRNTGRKPPSPDIMLRKVAAQEEGAIGVDVSRGGRDDTIISERLENWFGTLTVIPGRQTTDGDKVVQTIINLGYAKRRIQIDITGVGTSPVDIGRMLGMNIIAMVGSEKSYAKDKSGKLSFINLRAQYWWQFREALDPVLGDNIALPPDPGLLADLTAPRWSLSARGIQVEAKEHIKARLGRSPDKGDAVVNAHATPYLVGEGYLAYLKEEVDQMREDEAIRTQQKQALQSPQSQSQSQQGIPV